MSTLSPRQQAPYKVHINKHRTPTSTRSLQAHVNEHLKRTSINTLSSRHQAPYTVNSYRWKVSFETVWSLAKDPNATFQLFELTLQPRQSEERGGSFFKRSPQRCELLGKSSKVAASKNRGVQEAVTTRNQLLRTSNLSNVDKLHEFLQEDQPPPTFWRGRCSST
jgi:hypothetical protein